MRKIDTALKTWIAENLIAGCPAETLVSTLVDLTVPKTQAQSAVKEAEGHPYLEAAKQLQAKLNRREALLTTLDYYQRMNPEYLKLPRRKLPPFKEFLAHHYSQNKPGLFKNAVDHWAAMEWTPKKLVGKVGADTVVEVQQNRESNSNYERDSIAHKSTMRFGDFIDGVESKETNDFYLTANNQALKDTPLKVLINDIGTLGDGYLDSSQSEGRTFLWVGPKGIVTPLHHDRTNNAFIQIYGTKRFRLIPALQAPYMYNNIAVFSEVDLLSPDEKNYPLYRHTSVIDVVLKPGDFLFIPIGWWHHVVGETASISLSFTNFSVPNNYLDKVS